MNDKITLKNALEDPIWLMVYAGEPYKKIDVTMSYVELKAIYDMVNAKRWELADKTHWISVEERLPNDNESVLVYRCGDNRVQPNMRIDVCPYLGNGIFCMLGVTHWMPLPEPPEGNEDGSGQT